jgi:AcrR family transcriptional regulator
MIGAVAAELPVVQPSARRERADAARNRRRILEAAAALVAERGIEAISMDDVARAACVGTGTLYRRFGDRAGLALALLDEHTRDLQDALLAGPPPLGPGAPAAERLMAFGAAYVDLLERHAELMAAGGDGSDAPGPHTAYALHVAHLLRQAAPAVDAEYGAEALLAALAPGAYLRQRRGLGWPPERVLDGWRGVAAALVTA